MDETPRTDLDVTPPQPPSGPRRLHRSSSNKMLLGVCGGLGEHFDIDPTILRLLFVVGLVLGGTSLVLYIVLAVIMPSDRGMEMEPRDAARQTVDEAVDDLKVATDKLVAKVRELTGKVG
ncbi:MAG TPA: PspC domain-containing protein [Thermomicrobiales bacterium]|nr:PspC domain-containing protein [Thermomicrobiales bacterium]